MKPSNTVMIVSLMILCLLSMAVMAGQGPGPGGPPPPRDGFPLFILDLTDAQKEQVKAIEESERVRIEPFLRQIDEARKALDQATAGGEFNEAQIRAIAAGQSRPALRLDIKPVGLLISLFAG